MENRREFIMRIILSSYLKFKKGHHEIKRPGGLESRIIGNSLYSVWNRYGINARNIEFIQDNDFFCSDCMGNSRGYGKAISSLGDKKSFNDSVLDSVVGHFTESSVKQFIDFFGREAYESLKGRDIIITSDIENLDKKMEEHPEDMAVFKSRFIENLSIRGVYERIVLHEMGHILLFRGYPDSVLNFIKAFHHTNVYLDPERIDFLHRGHASWLSYNNYLSDYGLYNSLFEQISETFAFDTMGIRFDYSDASLMNKALLVNTFMTNLGKIERKRFFEKRIRSS